MPNVLSVDVSTQKVKAAIFDERGEKLSSAALPHRTYGEPPFSEQDPNEWWKNVKIVVKAALADEKAGREIRAVVADGTPYGVIPVDKDGNPWMRAITYVDKRAVKQAAEIAKMPEFKEITKAWGQRTSPNHPIPKILWLKENLPEIFDKTHMFLDPTAYVNFKLTGRYFTNAWDNFRAYGDPVTGELPKQLLDKLGVGINKFPQVYNVGSKTFKLLPEVTKEFGLSPESKVVVATNDSGLALIGSGICRPGEVSESCGSASVVKVLTGGRVEDPQRRVYPQPALSGWCLSGYEMAGAVLEWYKKGYVGPGDGSYAVMNREAEKAPVGACGVFFIPYLYGANCPNSNPSATARFAGNGPETGRANLTRAVYESMGYVTRDILETFEGVGAKVGDIRVSGGLARSDTLTQIKADILGRRILVLKEEETTALGAAIVAESALGVYPSIEEASKSMVKVRRTFKPNPEHTRTHDGLFAEWKRVCHTTL